MKNIFVRYPGQITILILALGLFWIVITSLFFNRFLVKNTIAPTDGFPAPNFSLKTIEGELINLSSYKNQVLLVNFWTSWCPPCKTEMPAMQSVYELYKDKGFNILAINVTNQDDIGEVKRFSSKHHLTFPILLDIEGKVTNIYQIHSFPTSFFIDRSGVIHETIFGGPMSEALLKTRVEDLLAGK
jgi:peroxiredoxin